MSTIWPFADPPDLRVYVLRDILVHGTPVLYVSHDEDDGSWCFWGSETPNAGDIAIADLAHIYQRDPSIGELADLPLAWEAQRNTIDDPWERRPVQDEIETRSDGYVKVRFPITWPEDGNEGIWCLPQEDGTFVVHNIPWYVEGIAWGDAVTAHRHEGVFYYSTLFRRSGYSLVRVLCPDPDVQPLIQHFEDHGCATGWTNTPPNVVSISVPPAVDLAEIRAILQRGIDEGRWTTRDGYIHSTD